MSTAPLYEALRPILVAAAAQLDNDPESIITCAPHDNAGSARITRGDLDDLLQVAVNDPACPYAADLLTIENLRKLYLEYSAWLAGWEAFGQGDQCPWDNDARDGWIAARAERQR